MKTNLLLLFSATVFGLAGLELGVRLIGEASPALRTRGHRPGFYYKPTASESFQDFTYSTEKPPDTFRIVVVGDSFTFPTLMQFDDALPKRLERMLNLNTAEKGEGGALAAQVLSYGRRGASTKTEVGLIRRALGREPDLLILQVTLNDPQRESFQEVVKKFPGRYAYGALDLTPEQHPVLARWKTLGLIARRIHNWRTRRSLISYHRDMYERPETWETFTRSMQKIAHLAKTKETPLVAVVFPFFYDPLGPEYPYSDLHERIHSVLASSGITYLDLFPAYEGIPHEQLQVLPGRDTHPNEIAHRIAAEYLYLWLEQLDLIPEAIRIKEKFGARGERP